MKLLLASMVCLAALGCSDGQVETRATGDRVLSPEQAGFQAVLIDVKDTMGFRANEKFVMDVTTRLAKADNQGVTLEPPKVDEDREIRTELVVFLDGEKFGAKGMFVTIRFWSEHGSLDLDQIVPGGEGALPEAKFSGAGQLRAQVGLCTANRIMRHWYANASADVQDPIQVNRLPFFAIWPPSPGATPTHSPTSENWNETERKGYESGISGLGRLVLAYSKLQEQLGSPEDPYLWTHAKLIKFDWAAFNKANGVRASLIWEGGANDSTSEGMVSGSISDSVAVLTANGKTVGGRIIIQPKTQ